MGTAQHQRGKGTSSSSTSSSTFVWIWGMLKTAIFIGAMLALMLAPSRDWAWPSCWFTVAAFVFLQLLPNYLYISAYNPDLIQEREGFMSSPGLANFERYIMPAIVLVTPARFLAAGLQHMQDMQRPGWSPAPFLSTREDQLAAAALVLSYAIQTWSVCSNRYFSSVVRVQSNRGHKVCDQGPYAYVRHPGYVGFSLQGIAEALLLHSHWAMAWALAKAALLAARTVCEDAFLCTSLPGYATYAQQVRHRWVPGVW